MQTNASAEQQTADPSHAAAPTDAQAQKNLRRVVISSLVGAVIEWYDFFLYGVVAGIVFNKVFFPDFDPTVGTILAFATFAVGFVARPVGGIIFGHFGDKLGRKKMLVLTLEIMGVATVGIGLVPSYETLGIAAPILLVLCRLAQGIGIGGEWGGAVLMAFESAPEKKRAFYGSLPQVGLALGLMLASAVVGILSWCLSEEAFLAYAAEENLEATTVAVVTESPRLVLLWRGKEIVNISRAFLDTNGAHQETSVAVDMPDENQKYFVRNEVGDVRGKWMETLKDLTEKQMEEYLLFSNRYCEYSVQGSGAIASYATAEQFKEYLAK